MWTTQALINWTSDAFAKAGIDSPRLDAEILFAHVLKVDRIQLFLNHERPASEEERAEYRALVKRRLDGECVAWLVGNRPFYNIELEVGPGVLVPRPETEGLVDLVLNEIQQGSLQNKTPDSELSLADLCSGSGCVGLALLHELGNSTAVLYELSDDAFPYLERNTHAIDPDGHRTSLHKANVLDCPHETYDIVTANPPYLTLTEMESAAPEVLREPEMALVAGADGLDWYKAWIPQATSWLNPGGMLALEIGIAQGPAVRALCETAGLAGVVVHKDFSQRDRFVVGYLPAD